MQDVAADCVRFSQGRPLVMAGDFNWRRCCAQLLHDSEFSSPPARPSAVESQAAPSRIVTHGLCHADGASVVPVLGIMHHCGIHWDVHRNGGDGWRCCVKPHERLRKTASYEWATDLEEDV